MAGERILIVEDSMIVVMHLKTVLREAGFNVIASVATGEDALKIIESGQPDLIMMDIMLAGEMDGIATASIVQHKFKIPVIFLTALTDRKTIDRAKITGPFNYVTKPFDEEDIITRVELSLYKSKIEKELQRKRISSLIEGQEIERERVSRELHDGLGQLLNAIQINIESMNNENFEEIKNVVRRLIKDSLIETHRISANLLPLNLIDFDLITCLRSLCKSYSTDIIQVIFQTEELQLNFNESQKLGIYRIVQEAIQNAIKHSECKKIFVQLYKDEHWVQLSIEDDGKGFDSSKANSEGHGLRNIRYRTQVLNGKFQIESNNEFGTLITVAIPVEADHETHQNTVGR